LFYVSFAGVGIGLGLEGAGLFTAGLDYNTGANASPVPAPTTAVLAIVFTV